ncbi:MFS family permease [Arthrobacter sp. V4I6]|uniref:MFS transporter n=1 Tax=unclassified Arthrobacter TaxID=235627 RepID=UPI002789BA1D|nr:MULTISPECIES: MFS transporter [unclassified Arthrobacter]MDQ0819902.1 MFS family permease [Arthrobacter sp. V1I7]MDQ0854083.1 MFS family permease [Arthrobacter sp. V4I6]
MPFSRHRGEAGTLLGAQLVFNLGFYAVIPFLAGAMGDDYGLDAVAVGLVLGARTFSQQGMFLLGGLLSDRWGARRAILIGCLVRISGYAALAAASDFSLFLLGAVLTGAGGALFSPALESQLSQADRATDGSGPAGGKKGRRSVFVWLSVTGEIGALLGPLLGASLLGWGFDAALALGMGIFSVVTVSLWFRLPADASCRPPRAVASEPEVPRNGHHGALDCLRNRRFVLFCVLASTNMLAYNQLYFAVPLELGRRGLDGSWLAMLFLQASVLTLVLQLPVSAIGHRLGPGRALSVGFVLLSAAFIAAALTSEHAGSSGNSIAPMAATIALLILGHMLLTPTILSVIPRFLPGEGPASGRGAYYGLAASCGGISVLVGNAVMGQLVDLTDRLNWWPGTPWVPPVLLAFLSALALPRVLLTKASPSSVSSRTLPASTAEA